MVICILAFPSTSLAQGASPAATPPPVPTFSIRAINDSDIGYFDDIRITPGASTTLSVEIKNTGDIPVALSIFKVNALSGMNGGFLAGDPDDPPLDPTGWIDFPEQEIQLAAGEAKDISFTATVPENASPGQYISGLIAKTSNSLEIPGSTVFRQYLATAITIGILVPGEIAPSFEPGQPQVLGDAGTLRIDIPVINTGNYLVRPAGELTLTDTQGQVVLRSQIDMGSIYAGRDSAFEIVLPDQMPLGDYKLNASLADPESGATAELVDVPIAIEVPMKPADATPAAQAAPVFSVTNVRATPYGDPVQYADITATIVNNGSNIATANVILNVQRNGEEIERYPLSRNQALPVGETAFSQRYVPADGWKTGEYTFQLVISSVSGGTEVILSTTDVEDTIAVP